MSETHPLETNFAGEVLEHLGVSAARATPELLERLIGAYTRKVPWESASRIARAASIPDTKARARGPQDFWRDAMALGSGGTCFESNYAFASLLWALGFDAYLTINDMEETRACHTAIIVRTTGKRFLVDAGFPLYTPIPVERGRATAIQGIFHNYTLTPLESHSYVVRRDRHPNPYAFTLIDRPVSLEHYRAAAENDYAPGGFFLDRVIITRVVDEQVQRFDSAIQPYRLQAFANGHRVDRPLPENPAPVLGRHFEMDAGMISAALQSVECDKNT